MHKKFEEVNPGAGTILALMDLERHYEDVEGSPVTTREVRIVRKFITRQGILEFLDVDRECDQRERPCLVWRNKIWKQQDRAPKELFHGDQI